MSARPRPLAYRIALLAAAVSVLTAVVGGVISIGLIRHTSQQSAQKTLAKLADAAQAAANEGASAQASQLRARQELLAVNVQVATINQRGVVAGRGKLAVAAATPEVVDALLAGETVSMTKRVGGQLVLIEGRPTNAGGLVLAQRRADAVAVGDRAVRLILVALGGAVVLSIGLSLLVTWRLARPLRRTAQAAHQLAVGRRDILVEPEGPAEMVDVAIALNVLSTNLATSESRQREFLLAVSHDLRTPLTAISGYAESLVDGVVTDTEVPRVAGVMLEEARRLERMIADLLDLARLDSAEFQVDLIDVDLTGWAHAAAEVWRSRCAANGVRFSLQAPPAPFWVRTDPARLRQAIDGLLENALRVTPVDAPILLALGSSGRAADGAPVVAVIEVRDGGPGLRDEDLPVAFDRSVLYERYRGVRQVGTGLGLAIVKGLATRLGAQVTAGHAPEGGAQFTVWLPITPVTGTPTP
ncbi:two-component system sensor histidine kinase BaeS [Jatrophihabitans sp. GAS493]|uniref:sensor histidine kinase n=1 Tax=Jatrophihabitans sp. GAS493 TaxID=1907575 RepID=UPI000BB6EC48|nr:HAMP domain-containing sensor histidine kinase [Jatrophihabitans sp. GAS493]SOD73290.1 two-component system sensor histidine kinase BaeS [Jatrophihabitans sp. GAS493]